MGSSDSAPTREAGGGDPGTRERLIAAGIELFGKKGFHGCGLNEILHAADVPKGSFYHHFSSKGQFGVALVERARDLHLAKVQKVLENRRLSPATRLRSLFERSLAEWTRSGDLVERVVSKLAVEAGEENQAIRNAARCAHQQRNALLAQVIHEGQVAGEVVPSLHANHLANLLVTWWEGMNIRLQIDGAPQSAEDAVGLVFRSLLA